MHRLVDRSTGTGAPEEALRMTTIKQQLLEVALRAVLRATKPDRCFSATG